MMVILQKLEVNIIKPKEEQTVKSTVKDSVFCHLFQDKRYLLQLYQALHPEDTEATEDSLTNITIDNVLMNGQFNDLGFRVDDRLMILAEAQSTWSPNIIIRAQLYLMESYQKYFSEIGADLYGSKKINLPRPELYVIFVGKRTDHPSEISLTKEFFGGKEYAIDARAKIIYGSVTPCADGQEDIIGQYIAFTKIYDAQRQLHGKTRTAIEETIRICRERNILKDYLQECEKEVTTIMSFLFDKETIYKNHDNTIRGEVRDETKEEAARKMLSKGKLSVEEIAEYLDLPVNEVQKLEAEILQKV